MFILYIYFYILGAGGGGGAGAGHPLSNRGFPQSEPAGGEAAEDEPSSGRGQRRLHRVLGTSQLLQPRPRPPQQTTRDGRGQEWEQYQANQCRSL